MLHASSCLACRASRSQRREGVDDRKSAADDFFKEIAAAANMSTAPSTSAAPNCSERTTTPTATAITGLTKAYSPARNAPQSRSSRT